MKPIVRRAVVALAVAAIVLTGAFVLAQGGPPQHRPGQGGQPMHAGPGGPGGMFGPMMLGRLNLTDDQRAQIQKLMDENRQAHQPLMQKMVDAQKALRDAVFADNGPDQAAISAAEQQVQALEPQVAQQRLQMEMAVAKILTPDQRKQLREMPPMGPGGPRHMGGRGMRHGGF